MCYKKWYSENLRGENHKNYKDRIKHICEQCGKDFFIVPCREKYNANRFCSKECEGVWNSYNRRGQSAPGWKGGKKIKYVCEVCGKEHAKFRHDKPMRYCSKECRDKGNVKQFSGSGNPMFSDAKLTSICKYCGIEFDHYSGQSDGSFCSKKCHDRYQIGENNPNWNGGSSFFPYCPKFNNDLRERVRSFWGYKCGYCGKTQEENGRALNVHHVHYDKLVCCNDREIILFIPLCCSCHSKTNGNREDWESEFEKIITDRYGGKSYYSKEEYESIITPTHK